MSSESVLSLRDVSKCYRIFNRPPDRLKQFLFPKRRYFTEFWALRDISFQIEKGSCTGIIGRNGAGKSSLLQLIAGTLSPTAGEIQRAGSIAALLELGSGFNPEFTGRENVFLNGSILGFSQEQMRERYEEIIQFADIGPFIDQPVKTYSSGMMIRLAFAVAINVDPEILIVDEALSVGDAKFQARCFRRFEEFKEQKKTILFVTHATEQVLRHCDRAILLEGGQIEADGEPTAVTNRYLELLFGNSSVKPARRRWNAPSTADAASVSRPEREEIGHFLAHHSETDYVPLRPGYNKSEFRWGDKEAEIIDYLLESPSSIDGQHFDADEELTLYCKVRFHRAVERPIYGLTIKTPDGVTVYGSNSRDWGAGRSYVPQEGGDVAVVRFSLVPRLVSGHYLLSLGVAEESVEQVVPLDRRYDLIEIFVNNRGKAFGIADLGLECDVLSRTEQAREAVAS